MMVTLTKNFPLVQQCLPASQMSKRPLPNVITMQIAKELIAMVRILKCARNFNIPLLPHIAPTSKVSTL